MRKEEVLITLLRRIAELVADESARNPEFAARLENLLIDLPKRTVSARKRVSPRERHHVPDIHAELSSRGETDFRLWLRDQPPPVLRSIIRAQDLDPTRRSNKWKDAEKLADFIADGVRARLLRGSAFIGRPRDQ